MKSVLGLAVGLVIGAYYTWVAWVLYDWFGAPLTHVDLRFWQMYGLSLIIDVLFIGCVSTGNLDDDPNEFFVGIAARALLVTITLALGYIIHLTGLA